MNVFEDLIEELKGENLLEGTVFDQINSSPQNYSPAGSDTAEFAVKRNNTAPAGSKHAKQPASAPAPENESDFYRKRAMQEVSSLQMVEHVLSGVEREHLKAVPSTYDDLHAKKALHRLLQFAYDVNSAEYAEAARELMQETGAWSSALSARDGRISVANIRRFCENSRPPLSSQALMSLARFYRNSAYTEANRSKFDFVMTRLFARETDYQKRKLLFDRSEMIGHIESLYANWSSISYAANMSEAEQKLIVASFQARIKEADQAKSFDDLVKDDFFKKIHEFKESLEETFFIPAVTAAAIECNVRVGNKFVELVKHERGNLSASTIEEKYGYTYDHIISNAAGRTLHLVELLKGEDEAEEAHERGVAGAKAREAQKAVQPTVSYERAPVVPDSRFAVNKWLLLATILVAVLGYATYFWASQSEGEGSAIPQASQLAINDSDLSNYIENGRKTNTTFYAVTRPAWNDLSDEKRKEVLQKTLEFGKKNGVEQVQLLNNSGRNVAFAVGDKLEVHYQQ